MMHPFRIFLSYAHEDKQLAECIDDMLKELGFIPVWDRHIRPGTSFTDTIKIQIATAHLFMPLITRNSQNRPWVHQEMGFAIGNDVSVLPVVFNNVGVEMNEALQAMIGVLQPIEVKEDLSNFATVLKQSAFEVLVLSGNSESELERLMISNHIADHSQERTRLLIEYAKTVHGTGHVYQQALFSSFSFPDKNPSDPAWDVVDPPNKPRSEYFRKLIREERKILEKHAQESGCSLIVSPYVELSSAWTKVHCAQLQQLLVFLKSMPANMLSVVVLDGERVEGNLVLVGDWVGAKVTSLTSEGYRNTVFSRHARTVLRWLREFEQELDLRFARLGVKPDQSKDYAISQIERLLDKCS